MSTSTFSLQNLKHKVSTLLSPSMVGTPSGADVGGVARLPSSAAKAVQESNVKPSKGMLFYLFFSDDSASKKVCGVKRGVGSSICIDLDCTIAAHQGKYCHVLPNHVYVKKNESTAFLEPSVDVSLLDSDIKSLWESEAVSIFDWQARFEGLETSNDDLTSPDKTTESIKKALTFRSPLQSPSLSPVKEDLLQDMPTFEPSLPPVGASNLNEVVPPALLKIETALAASIDHYTKTLSVIQDRLTDSELATNFKSQELALVGVKVDSFVSSIGNLLSGDFLSYSSPTLSSTIEQVCRDLTNTIHPAVSATASKLSKTEASLSNVKDKIQEEVEARLFLEKEVTETVTTIIEKVSEIASRLSAFEAVSPTTGNSTASPFASLRAGIQTGNFSSTSTPFVQSQAPVDVELSSQVADLSQRLTNLELGSSGDGVSINGLHFENLDDLTTYMADNKITSVGEFVCVYVALQERVSHNDSSALLGRLEKQRKLQLASNFEAYAVESFTSDIPSYFHTESNGTDFDKSYLNNLPSHKKWSASSHGDKARLMKDILSITTGYTHWINSEYNHTEPRYHLAMFCLMKTTEFLRAWLGYMDYVTDDLVINGYSIRVAWALATRLSRRIYEDLSVPRQGVKGSLGHPLVMRASVLWGILKTHAVMKEYIDMDFKNHPSMASEYVRFVVTTPRESGSEGLETQVADLKKKLSEQKKETSEAQKSATTASNKVAALTTSLKSFEARVKKLEK